MKRRNLFKYFAAIPFLAFAGKSVKAEIGIDLASGPDQAVYFLAEDGFYQLSSGEWTPITREYHWAEIIGSAHAPPRPATG